MSKNMPAIFTRTSPLANSALPGRFGASHAQPGVRLSVVHPLSLVLVTARKSKVSQDVLKALRGPRVMWAGADQFYVQSANHSEGALATELSKKLGSAAAVVDQSHGRITLRVAGPNARNVLAKGTPVDLHRDQFTIGKSVVTQMAHVGVHLTRIADDEFELSVFRGFAESFWQWLTEQSAEFGYQVS